MLRSFEQIIGDCIVTVDHLAKHTYLGIRLCV